MMTNLAFKPNADDPTTRTMQGILYAYAGTFGPIWAELAHDVGVPGLRERVESGDPLGFLPLKLLEAMDLRPGVLKGTHTFSGRPLASGNNSLPPFCVKGDVHSGKLLGHWLLGIEQQRPVGQRQLAERVLHLLLPDILPGEVEAAEVLAGRRPLPWRALVALAEYLNLCGGGASHELLVQLLHGPSFNPPRFGNPQPVRNLLERLKRYMVHSFALPPTKRLGQSGANTHTLRFRDNMEDDADEEEAVAEPVADAPAPEPEKPVRRRQTPRSVVEAKVPVELKTPVAVKVPAGIDPAQDPLQWLEYVLVNNRHNRAVFGQLVKSAMLAADQQQAEMYHHLRKANVVGATPTVVANLLKGNGGYPAKRLKAMLGFVKCTPAEAVAVWQKLPEDPEAKLPRR
ncbi:MAG TPA: hypothetical protein VHP58_01315 [Alphaproteobacteria bacterium]|nr:hypothetical protein [Alphaproteobacteria bacterium]